LGIESDSAADPETRKLTSCRHSVNVFVVHSQEFGHDDKFTYIKTNAPEKFSVYEMKDGKPNLISYDLRDGTYIIPKVMDSGYVELGKKKMEFTRKG
jgi:type IV secretion system protein VirB9